MSLLTDASLLLTPNANATSKLYSIIPSNGNGDFTGTRATTATRVNSSGLIETTAINMIRRDYSLGGCPNILLEPQRTNLALQSSSFDNATWVKQNTSVTANATTSPSGIQDADKIVEDVLLIAHNIFSNITTVSGSVYNVSFYAKAAERGYIQYNNAQNTSFANFDLINGVVGTSSGVTNEQIQSVGNGWYRCSLNITATSTGTAAWYRISIVPSASATRLQSYLGDGTSGLFIWGAQWELGAYATSYIPTTTASVTRNGDNITRNNIFTNGLITAAGGTWFVELRNNIPLARDNASAAMFINTGTSPSIGDGFRIRNGGNSRFIIDKIVASTPSTSYTTLTDVVKIAIKWNGSTADYIVNGVKVVSATAFTATAMENLNASCQVPFFINEMALFPTPLTDAQCIALTQ